MRRSAGNRGASSTDAGSTDAGSTDAGVADAGMTLIDVLVAMTIMTVVTALFTAGIGQMYRMVNGTDNKSVAQSQVSTALLRLDKDVRYASGISAPYPLSGNQYVDFLLPKAGTSMCVQLRVAAGKLQRRTWTWKVTPFAPTAWVTLASSVTSATPFSYAAPDTEISYQRLTVDLKVTIGTGTKTVVKNSKVTYTALNTTTKSLNTDCIAGRTGV
jgi:type II secretory pathway pseudopilin PulG